jgi:hypothetical protein
MAEKNNPTTVPVTVRKTVTPYARIRDMGCLKIEAYAWNEILSGISLYPSTMMDSSSVTDPETIRINGIRHATAISVILTYPIMLKISTSFDLLKNSP